MKGFPRRSAARYTALPRQLLLALLLMGMATSAPAAEKWHRAQAGNIEIYGNCAKKTFQRFHNELTLFREALAMIWPGLDFSDPHPIRVFLARNARSLKRYGPLTLEGEPKNSDGAYSRGPAYDTIIIDASEGGDRRRHIIYHEYMHRLMSRNRHLPLWFHEGVAEFVATIEVKKDAVIYGKPDINHLIFLNNFATWIPMERFLRVDHTSEDYGGEHGKTHEFYAQSWLFVYYCLLADDQAHREAFAAFLTDLPAMSDPEAGIRKHFGVSAGALQERMADYAKSDRYSKSKIDAANLKRPGTLELHAVPPEDRPLIEASLLIGFGRRSEASDILDELEKAGDASSAEYHYLRARAYLELKYRSHALESLDAARRAGSPYPGVCLLLAALRLTEIEEGFRRRSDRITTAQLQELLAILYEAQSKDADAIELYQLLARVWNDSDHFDAKHVDLVYRGWQKYPDDYLITRNLVETLLRANRRELAESILDTHIELTGDESMARFIQPEATPESAHKGSR